MFSNLRKKDGYSGLMSMIYIVIVLIAIYGIMAFSEIVSRAYLINETQSIMDVAGLSALRAGLDDEELRLERFVVHETVVNREYRKLLQEALGDYGALVDYKIMRLEIRNINENWGLGISSREREQAILDSTVLLIVDSYTPLDVYPALQKTFHDGYESEDFTLTYMGQTEDGQAQLMVRSVTRLVYR